MVGAYADPSLVSAQVVDLLRIGPSKVFVDEVMNLHFHRLPAGQLLPSGILVGAHQLLFLGINRDDGLIRLRGC